MTALQTQFPVSGYGLAADLTAAGKITPPAFIEKNLHSVAYEVIVGSHAFGTATSESDYDVVGVAFPPIHYLFPHLNGEITGYRAPRYAFEKFQQGGVPDAINGKPLDLTVYNIVKFIKMCEDGVPNALEVLFAPSHCVIKALPVMYTLWKRRNFYLTQKCIAPYLGYAKGELSRAIGGDPQEGGKRKARMDAGGGADFKGLSHAWRLLCELEGILTDGELEVGRYWSECRTIRAGEVPINDFLERYRQKKALLESLSPICRLPERVDAEEAHCALLDLLSLHYDGDWRVFLALSHGFEQARQARVSHSL